MMNKNALISPEILVPRLGEQLVSMNLLSDHQLAEILAYQDQCANSGKPVLMGQAILDKGFLDRPTLDKAITEQILQLRAALEDSNRHLEIRVKQRTDELEKALQKLFEMNQWKSNFIANISHELRTPLTHIVGYLDLLETETLGSINKEQKEALVISLSASQKLQDLIDSLIMFSQATRGQMVLNLQTVDLKKTSSLVIERLRSRLIEKGLQLETIIEDNLPLVRVDEAKIIWVLNQLLDNAIKFTNRGGIIALKIQSSSEEKRYVSVTVTDTGIGISQDLIKTIFEPFRQVEDAANRHYGGTGIGLTLVLQIIEAHGSIIEVESRENAGTSVTFKLLIQ